jgi:hypothetical protein
MALLASTAAAQNAADASAPQADARASEGAEKPAAPTPAASEEAATRFRRGLEFYEEQEYALALVEFEKAHQLVPDYRVLFNIAQVSIQMGHFARARIALERYQAEGAAELTDERRAQVEKDLRMLGARTATLTVTTTPAGAEILVDDVSVGLSPLAQPLLIDAGEHRVSIKKRLYVPKTERVTLAGAEEFQLKVELLAEEVAPPIAVIAPPKTESKPAPAPSGSLHPLVIPGWITTGAFAAGAAVTGILGAQAAGDLSDLKEKPGSSASDRDDAASRAQTYLVTSDVLWIATGVALGTTLYFTFWGNEKPTSTGALPAAPGRQAQVSFGPGSVALRGQF